MGGMEDEGLKRESCVGMTGEKMCLREKSKIR